MCLCLQNDIQPQGPNHKLKPPACDDGKVGMGEEVGVSEQQFVAFSFLMLLLIS